MNFIESMMRGVIAFAVMCSIALATPAVPDMHSRPVIKGEDIDTALAEFVAQTHLQVLYDASVAGLKTRPVDGTLEAVPAMREMVRGGSVTVEVVDDATLALRNTPTRTQVSAAALPEIKIKAPKYVGGNFANTGPIADAQLPFIPAGMFTLDESLKRWPQVAGGDCQDALDILSRVTLTNSGRGCGVNWRYLGAGSVLVLLDGMRLPGSGTYGLFVDVMHLPAFLLGDLEPLRDHSSTQYGNDAIAGVLNFRLGRCADGSDLRVGIAPNVGRSVGRQQYGYRFCGGLGPIRGMLSAEYLAQSRLPAEWRLQATSDLRRWGGLNNDNYFGSPGTIVDGARTWAIPNHPFTADQLVEGTVNLYDTLHHIDLLPAQRIWTLFGAGESHIFSQSTLSAYGVWSVRNASATLPAIGTEISVPPGNPWYQHPTGESGPIHVMYGFQGGIGYPVQLDKVVNSSVGLRVQQEVGSWRRSIDVGYGNETEGEDLKGIPNQTNLRAAANSEDPKAALDVFGDGTSHSTWRSISAQSQFTASSSVLSLEISAAGTMYQAVSGELTSNSGLSYRRESLSTQEHTDGGSPDVSTAATRRVVSVFEELCLPLKGEAGRRCDQPEFKDGDLRMILGGRYEHYSNFGSNVVPSIRLKGLPLSNLMFEIMWTEGVKPPGLRDGDESGNISQIAGVRPSPGSSELVPALIWTGGSSDLVAERVKSFSASATVRLGSDERSSIQLHYFNARVRNRIGQPVISAPTLTDAHLRGLVTLVPTSLERHRVCSRSQYMGVAGDCESAPISAIIDGRLGNLSDLDISGFDLDARKFLDTALGRWTFGVLATYYFQYDSVQFGDRQSLLDTPDNALRLRGRSSVSWHREDLEATVEAVYRRGYRDFSSGQARRVASWTTYNIEVSESFDHWAMWGGSGLTLILTIENILNSMPPYVGDPTGFAYDVVNADLFGRSIRITLRKHW